MSAHKPLHRRADRAPVSVSSASFSYSSEILDDLFTAPHRSAHRRPSMNGTKPKITNTNNIVCCQTRYPLYSMAQCRRTHTHYACRTSTFPTRFTRSKSFLFACHPIPPPLTHTHTHSIAVVQRPIAGFQQQLETIHSWLYSFYWWNFRNIILFARLRGFMPLS